MKNVLLTSLLFFSVSALAQTGPINSPSPGIIDGVYLGEHVPTRKRISYPTVVEADVIWSKRVWSSIDLREKINQTLYYPLDEMQGGIWTKNSSRWSLWTVIRTHVLNGDLTLFSPYNPILMGLGANDGDQLKYPITPQPGLNYDTDKEYREELAYYLAEIGPLSNIKVIDENPESENFGEVLTVIDSITGDKNIVYESPDTNWIMSEQIIQYRIKEDWFFDKERSVLDARIIALAPVRYTIETSVTGQKQITGTEEIFWLYFPQCRYVFNNYYTYNSKNDAQQMSFEDLFWKRRFSSVVYKESNVYDRDIESYRAGVDALMESDLVKNEIRSIEHDVWSF